MEVVYKATRESLPMVMELLRNEGLNPIIVDNPSPFVLYWFSGTYLISVAVPSEQASAARLLLYKWDQYRQPEVEKASKKLLVSFLFSVSVVAVLAALLLVLGRLFDFGALLLLIWIVIFALAANMDRIMQKVRRRKA